MSNFISIALRGIAMGIAEVIPGVSGGTIAFITGIYERLLNSIKAFSPSLFKKWKTGGLAEVWSTIDGNFLVALMAGMGAGVITGVFAVTHLLETYPVMLWSFFFGLIIASAIYIGKQVKPWGIAEIAGLVLGAGFAYWITILPIGQGSEALWFVFVSGALAISALILPGISGSFILLLLGMYTYIIPTLKSALKTFDTSALLVVVVFAAGCLLGLMSFARILSWTFKNYKNTTLAVLTGFMLGSLNKIWPWRRALKGLTEDGQTVDIIQGMEVDKILQEVNLTPAQYGLEVGEPYLIGAIVLMLVGFAVVFLMDRFGSSHKE